VQSARLALKDCLAQLEQLEHKETLDLRVLPDLRVFKEFKE
jgi:hypothetical protein